MANPKQKPQDVSTSALAAVLEITESEPVKGEDLITDPKLRKGYIAAKKRAKAKRH